MKYFALVSAAALLVACSSKATDNPSYDSSADSGAVGDDDANGDDTAADGGKKADAATQPFDAGEAGMIDAGPANQAACTKVAQALCDTYTRCGSFALEVGFGDSATCVKRTTLACLAKVTANDGNTDATWATDCAAAAPNLTCDQFVTQQLGACATKPGKRKNGSPCGDDDQCTSAFCARAQTSVCGTCSALSTAGGACVSGSCSNGFLCEAVGTAMQCDKIVRQAVGKHCNGNGECDVYNGIGCNPISLMCQTISVAKNGESCGVGNGFSLAVCAAEGTCTSSKVCAAGAGDGDTCSTSANQATGTNGPNCMGPAVCQGGKCALPAPNACN